MGSTTASVSIDGDHNDVDLENASDLRIAGDNNSITQRKDIEGVAAKLWIGGDRNTAALKNMSEITVAGDRNTVQYQGGNEADPVITGDRNQISTDQGLSSAPVSSNVEDESPFKDLIEAEKEALKESMNESDSGANHVPSEDAFRKAAEEKMNELQIN